MGAGAMGHMETSMFEQCGYGREAIQARLERNWTEMFEGPDKIYWENDEGLGYVMDTGNHDVRTEGMSYAMMIAVQYDRKDVFDKLWGWVMKYMFMTEG
ncbi:MAG: glycosyl hydrolase family 8, partial [Bifidobacterium catenulatum]